MSYPQETLKKVLYHFCDLKGFEIGQLKSRDYARFYKRIKELLERTDGDPDEVNKALDWMDEKAKDEYDWTLETVDKKWLEFKARKRKRVDVDVSKTDDYLKNLMKGV